MGNTLETSLFIKEAGDTCCYENLLDKRLDIVYVKPSENIKILSVGFCSPIQGFAKASFRIIQLDSGKGLYEDSFSLTGGTNSLNSFYQLRAPVRLVKKQFYKLVAEVSGGPTYSYEKMHDLATHRDVILKLTRDDPYAVTKSNTSDGSPDSSFYPEAPRNRTENRRTFKKIEESLKNRVIAEEVTPSSRNKSQKRKTRMSLGIENLENRDIFEDSNKNGGNPPTSLTRKSSKRFTYTSDFKRDNMNQITGIVFQTESAWSLEGCC